MGMCTRLWSSISSQKQGEKIELQRRKLPVRLKMAKYLVGVLAAGSKHTEACPLTPARCWWPPPVHYWRAALVPTCWDPAKSSAPSLFGATDFGKVMLVIFKSLKE